MSTTQDTMGAVVAARVASVEYSLLGIIQKLSLVTKLYVLLLVAALPLLVITGYLAKSAWKSSRAMAQEFPVFVLTAKREAQFKVFMEGVSDAFDTGTLSLKATEALKEARRLSGDLETLSGVRTPELLNNLALVVTAVDENRSLATLLPLRNEIHRSFRAIESDAEWHHRRLDEIVNGAIRASALDTWIALATIVLSMSIAIWIGRRLIQHIVHVERRAHDASALNQAIMDAAPIGMMTIGSDSLIATANRACHEIHGYAPGALVGLHVDALVDSDHRARHDSADCNGCDAGSVGPIRHALPSNPGRIQEAEVVHVRNDGSRFSAGVIAVPLRNSAGSTLGGLSMVLDITERKRAEARIEYLALHDSLTGLPNRVHLQGCAEHALARAQGGSSQFALALIDLDHFKQINDTLGHAVGDEVLKIVAQRLNEVVRSSDTVVRMGGDEFALLLPQIETPEQVVEVGQKILAAMSEVLVIEGHRLHVSASMGVAFYPVNGTELATLLRNADAAMYDAKSRGRDALSLYCAEMSESVVDQRELRSDLRQAVARGELILHYQPILEASSGQVRSLEALLRWNHPHLGLVPPNEFIPFAEESGLIVPIGVWVLHQACADLARLRLDGFANLRMAVNVSPRQFTADGLQASVRDALNAAGLDGSALELEITESVLMNSLERTQEVLTALRGMGVRIAIDDFGTGYSSLNYLAHFPVQTVKVDRSFVGQIHRGGGTARLAGAIISMAHSLGLDVVAEGVETLEQHRHLVKLGCEYLQGFRFSRPVAMDQLPAAMERVLRVGPLPSAGMPESDVPSPPVPIGLAA